MSTALRKIDAAPFREAAGEMPPLNCGAAPQLRWIEIEKLVVDAAYQRDLGGTGMKNILRIAREFDWTKFATVVVAASKDDCFAIVDGQHRTTAAALVGLKKVPCQIIAADQRRQAAAFAAINANVTEMSPMQLHAAKIAAGDPEAARLHKLCAEVGVSILLYPIQTKNQKPGETMAPGALYRALTRFGEPVLRAALSCVTRTRDGYPGFLRSPIITGLCTVMQAEPTWCSSPKLLPAMAKLDLREAFEEAWRTARAGSGGGVVRAIAAVVADHLKAEFAAGGPREAPAAAISATTPQPIKAADKNADLVRPQALPDRTGADGGVTHNGVTVAISAGRIEFRGNTVKIRPKLALLAALLARAMPAPIGEAFLLKRLWTGQKMPGDALAILVALAGDLGAALAPLGLEVRSVKHVGIAMRLLA